MISSIGPAPFFILSVTLVCSVNSAEQTDSLFISQTIKETLLGVIVCDQCVLVQKFCVLILYVLD